MTLFSCALLLLALQEPAAPPPTLAVTPSAPEASAPAPAPGSAADLIRAGLVQYHRLRFAAAAAQFEKAVAADPQSAAAAWYLGYAYYKIAEPKRPNDPDKQKAAEMFARAYSLDPQFRPDWRVTH